MDSNGQPVWADYIPTDLVRYVPVFRPKGAQRLSGTILSESIVGSWQHWVDEHTRPCTEPRDQCHGCVNRYRRQWRAYFGVVVPGHQWPKQVFEVTLETARAVGKRLEGQAPGIRGYRCHVHRRHGARRGMVLMEIEDRKQVAVLPPPFDVRAIVQAWLCAPPRVQRESGPVIDDGGWEVIPYPGVG